MRFEVVPMLGADIIAAARPQSADQPEAIPAVLYDTLSYPTTAPATALKFFQQVAQQDDTLTNPLVAGGSLPAGYSFRVQGINLDILASPSFTGNVVTGTLTDIANFLKRNRATVQFFLNNKGYTPIPATFCHASGGETGFVAASYTAPQGYQFGNNGIFDGGFETDGAIWILDKQPFAVLLTFGADATALSANYNIRMNLRGTLYRPIQ